MMKSDDNDQDKGHEDGDDGDDSEHEGNDTMR